MNYDDDAYELQLLQWLLLQHAVAALAAWHCFGCSPVDHESASAPSGLRRPSRRNQYEILNQIFSFGGKSKDLPFVTESFPAKFWIFPRAHTAASPLPPFSPKFCPLRSACRWRLLAGRMPTMAMVDFGFWILVSSGRSELDH